MNNINIALSSLIDSIQVAGTAKGRTITLKEIAERINIPEDQLQRYLEGKEQMPEDFLSNIRSAYAPKMVMFQVTEEVAVPDPEEDEVNTEESKRKSLEATIFYLKMIGETRGITITPEDIADKTGLTRDQLYRYLNQKEPIPDDLTGRLLSTYQPQIDTIELENNRNHLKSTVVWIRNHGLAVGKRITITDMAQQIGISEEELYACLNDESKVEDSWPRKLESAYKALIGDARSVEIIEDLHQIKKKPAN
ncbi:hypothetical protein SAMN04488128_104210 [Chitinophaga eiseniae]|uniref:Uncharacterized protein n=1 Tax=Chitinophaga eiseniae TaxID=634771 RepID=A0A1T4T9H6_9BACT|nr:hypothetical protein [Chitinophaga eiseniae]SKA37027.1 hypothetical protein SAMN04488128_104210 [Chitinophaga eiseniae]